MFNEFSNAVSLILRDQAIQDLAKDGALNLFKAIILKDIPAAIKATWNIKDIMFSIPDIIYADKMYRFLTNAFKDYEQQIKFAELFNKDDKKYKETVKKQLQILEKIDFDEKVDWFANLTKAVCLELINVDKYLKLSSALTMIFSDDLLFLKKLYKSKEKDENSTLSTLYAYNLVNKRTPNTVGSISSKFSISDDGIEMLRCGIDFENYDSYRLRGNANETKV